jgi:hypothetical protein
MVAKPQAFLRNLEISKKRGIAVTHYFVQALIAKVSLKEV